MLLDPLLGGSERGGKGKGEGMKMKLRRKESEQEGGRKRKEREGRCALSATRLGGNNHITGIQAIHTATQESYDNQKAPK